MLVQKSSGTAASRCIEEEIGVLDEVGDVRMSYAACKSICRWAYIVY